MFPDEEKTVKRGKDYMLADSVVTRWGAEHVRTEMKQLRKGEARRKEAEKELRRLKKDGLGTGFTTLNSRTNSASWQSSSSPVTTL